MRRPRLPGILCCRCLLAMLAVGRCTYKDYGMTLDEHLDRVIAITNYQQVMKTLFGRELEIVEENIAEWESLGYRYYGVALQLPMVLVEDLTGFTMPLHDAFALRHLYTFLVCLCGWGCFFLFCRKVYRNDWWALLGMLMVALYPRFWGEQFTNIKDMVFTATCCAALLGVALCLEHEGRWHYEVLGAFLSALCANTRFIGFQFPALLFGYRLIRDWWLVGVPAQERGKWLRKTLPRYLLHLVLVFAFYLAVTPSAWDEPLIFLGNLFSTFSNYSVWNGRVLFLGEFYPGNGLPWYYLPVWVLLSCPLWVLVLCLLGAVQPLGTLALGQDSVKKRFSDLLLGEKRYLVLCLVVALLPQVAPLLKEVTFYNSWRHAYYVFPMLVVSALFGLRWLFRKAGKNKCQAIRGGLIVGVCGLLVVQTGWIVLNHPYEKVYFNPIGRTWAEQMDRDHWQESDTHMLEVILRNDSTNRVTLTGKEDRYRVVHYFLPPELARRVLCVHEDVPSAEYVIDVARGPVEPVSFAGYTPVYQIRMQDGLLLSTLQIRDDVLQERFGGVYPEYNVKTQ